MRRVRSLALLSLAALSASLRAAAPADFPLAGAGQAAPLVVAASEPAVVHLAARDLAADIARVSDLTPAVLATPPADAAPRVLIGTLGHSPAIDDLAARGTLDVGALRGAWESFLLATLAPPAVPAPTLLIVGSDRRGTAFGIYELSQQIGVSPWHWWADVAPAKQAALTVPAGTRRFGPPSVRYRGIFLNDEDWGLQPWATTTFEPEHGGIGRRTYARVFELLLRLKANTLWPAMHACTRPFHAEPAHAALADDYAIVLGSSHAEPMLRNNVGEWPHDRAADYNYVTNRAGVRAYWEERIRANGRYENLYTLGMRGIHDSAIQGARTDAERRAVLTQVFADQRALLAAHVAPDVTRVPQIFCAYKEVLDLYRQGLVVPDDVTLVWPDDNFGYLRQFATPAERARRGGFGVYYHLSYLGRPLAYLWLSTTPPALQWSELTRAYAHGADRVWIANVGDLKPAERDTEFFLRLAWDVRQWDEQAQPKFLREWSAREFGPALAAPVAEILTEYYRLNFARRPEHLQWWRPNQPPRPSDLSAPEIATRLADFAQLSAAVCRLQELVDDARQAAFFELVSYPVLGSALANQRYFLGERGDTAAARAADAALVALNAHYDEIAAGKWRGFMRLEPASSEWRSMRLAPWSPPATPHLAPPPPPGQVRWLARDAARATGARAVPGLGRSGAALELPPGATLEFSGALPAGEVEVTLELLPTHPTAGDSHRLTLALDGAAPRELSLPVNDGGAEWAEGVLAAHRPLRARLTVPAAPHHTLTIAAVSAGLVLDRVVVTPIAPPAAPAPR